RTGGRRHPGRALPSGGRDPLLRGVAGTATGVGGLSMRSSELVLAIAVVGSLAIMVVPVPAVLLDTMITTDISVALRALLAPVSSRLHDTVDAPVLRSPLVAPPLFSPAINVLSARRVLRHGPASTRAAGAVINPFGQFVVGGNFLVLFVVFLILVMSHFVVI